MHLCIFKAEIAIEIDRNPDEIRPLFFDLPFSNCN